MKTNERPTCEPNTHYFATPEEFDEFVRTSRPPIRDNLGSPNTKKLRDFVWQYDDGTGFATYPTETWLGRSDVKQCARIENDPGTY